MNRGWAVEAFSTEIILQLFKWPNENPGYSYSILLEINVITLEQQIASAFADMLWFPLRNNKYVIIYCIGQVNLIKEIQEGEEKYYNLLE